MTVSMDNEGARAGDSEAPTVQEGGASPDRQGDEHTQARRGRRERGRTRGAEAAPRALSKDANVAVVVIQHLSPSHESLLTAALRAASPLRVVEVQDGMRIAAGQVHVIPPNTALVLEGDRLRVHRRDESARPPMPIDTFMRSLAAERKASAIGVVLSGTGSDGTQGLKAIRAAGGRTYAQEPSTAVHEGMPRSAIAADVVDLDPRARGDRRRPRRPLMRRPRAVEPRGDSRRRRQRVSADRPSAEGADRRGRLPSQADDAAAPDRAPDGPRAHAAERRVPPSASRGPGRAERAA